MSANVSNQTLAIKPDIGFTRFLQELEEDKDMRQQIDIYKATGTTSQSLTLANPERNPKP